MVLRALVCLFVGWGIAGAEVRLIGRIVNETSTPLAGARVALLSSPGTPGVRLVSDHSGAFVFVAPAAGDYAVSIDHEGFFQIKSRQITLSAGDNHATFVLNTLREVFEKVDVSASPPGLDPQETAPQEKLTGKQILYIPYPTTNNLRNALTLLPGVVQDRRGGIHVDGSSEEQMLYLLDGFNVGDPLTGRFESRLSVESVSEVEISRARFSAQYGKGAAGAVAIGTLPGDDQLRYSATNFFPGVENHKGLTIGNWTPRFNLSGPIRRARAWFSDSADTQFDEQVIEELPRGQDRTHSWRHSNLLRNQVNVTPSNIVATGFLVNYWNAPRTGLGFLSPIETTVDRRSRQWFFHAKDQQYFHGGTVFETGVAVNRTFGREIPQAVGELIITPDGVRGNYFVDAVRRGSRDQWITNVFLPAVLWHGSHRIKAGSDVDRVGYWQDARRTGYRNVRSDGTLLTSIRFGGNGRFGRSNFELAAYLQDSWQIHKSLSLELGIRTDHDSLIRNTTVSPRFGFAWAPERWSNTKISGGFGIVHDASHLRLFTRPLDQYSLTTTYDAYGALVRGPSLGIYTIDGTHFRAPLYRNLSLGYERTLPRNLDLRLTYFRKRGVDGLTYRNSVDGAAPPSPDRFPGGAERVDAVYRLGNDRRDVYDSLEITARQSLGAEHEWLVSYTRSRALSNAVVDISVDDPIIITNNVGPMPWDAPNRVVSWGLLPFIRKEYSVAYLVEWHTGHPFSAFNDYRQQVGKVNSFRYPDYFAMNLHIERRFIFHRNRWALRAGANNLTNRRNPNAVNDHLGSSRFLTFYGGTGRTFNFRFRFLGKVE